jgi:hypothetical protein
MAALRHFNELFPLLEKLIPYIETPRSFDKEPFDSDYTLPAISNMYEFSFSNITHRSANS